MAETSPSLLPVRELKADGASGRSFLSLLILKKASTRTASNGNPYLSVELGDKTGSFGSTVFSDGPAFEVLKGAAEGSVVRIEGRIDTYQGRLSPKILKAALVAPEELASAEAVANLVEVPPEDPEGLWKEFASHIEAIAHPELRAAVRGVIDEVGEAYRTAPAASAMHHAYRHGLLEHTVHMARAARALLPLYREVDPDMALAGVLLHDAGKTLEYEGAISARRSRRGILQGHVVLGYQLVRKAALKARLDSERTERLEHIILSHQGKLEWGAATMAATPEAVFVSMIDNLDARMGMVQRALRHAVPGEEFTERITGLEAPLLVKPLPGRDP